ncbi:MULTISPECIES: replicative DNA helicase [Paraburkholderia]|uniref:replicative DNA helicase n=1 Tax=Paraburkholderia TaxID=1822464 RepID=UPI0038B6CAB2
MNARFEEAQPDSVRIPPHSVEAEQSVLGALMNDNDSIDRISELRAEHFYRFDHRIIFEAISKMIMAQRRADLITVFESLGAAGKAAEIGGMAYLNALCAEAPSAAGIGRWAEIVIDRAKMRRLLTATDEVAELVYNRNGKTAAEIINEAQAKFEPLAEATASEPRFMSAFLTPVIERIDDQFHSAGKMRVGLSTGLRALDAKLGGGMRPGQLIIVAGRPGMGKTAIALGLAEAAAEGGAPTMFFSQEMEGEELCSRALARASGLSLEKVLDGKKFGKGDDNEDWKRLTAGVQKVSELGLIVDDRPAQSLAEIRGRARAAKRRHGLGLIVVDYLGLMAASEGNNRNEQVGANTRGLKALAKQLGIPVVLLAQLSRKCDDRTNKRPIVSDLRDSGEIEQDADVIIFLYRDEVYNPDSSDRGIAEINVAKQRNGPTGVVAAEYVGEQTLFRDLPVGYTPAPRTKPRQSKGFE